MTPLGGAWRKSSYSSVTGSCVEARYTGTRLKVRDSKDTTRPAFEVRPQAWRAFLGGAASR